MADREVRVLILGDASSLQTAAVKSEAAMSGLETRLKNAIVVSGEAGGMSDGLARKMSAMNSLGFTPAALGLVGVTAGLGLAVGAVGEMIDRSEKLTEAWDQLTNAIENNGYMVDQTRGLLETFLSTNKRFINDQSVVIDGYANMLRAGIPIQNLQRDLTLAMDVSIANHKDLSEAIKAVTDAELGRTRGLVEMGVNVKEITALAKQDTKDTTEDAKAHVAVGKATEQHALAVQKLADFFTIYKGKRLTPAELIQERDLKQKVVDTTAAESKATQDATAADAAFHDQINVTNAALDAASAKYKDAHAKLSEMKQAQNDLNASENDFSQRYGPAMEQALANGIDILNLTIQLITVLADKTIPHLFDQLRAAVLGASPTATPGGDRSWLNEGATQSSGGAPIPGHHGPGANIVIPVYGSNDPEATARAVARKLMAAFA